MVPLTPVQKEEICQLVESGMIARKVGVLYHRSRPHICRVYVQTRHKNMRRYRPKRRKPLTLQQRKNMEYLKQFTFEPFDEPGWAGFGMIVIQ